jgi:protein SCO1/2
MAIARVGGADAGGHDHAAATTAKAATHDCCTSEQTEDAGKLSSYTRSVADYPIPEVKAVRADGSQVPLRSELETDGPIIVNFIFTTCTTICPVLSSTFARVQELLRDDSQSVRMVSISIDPEQDTPGRLRAYAAKYQASPEWHFLTGALDDSIRVQRAFDAYRGGKMNHRPLTFIRASSEDPWVRLEGLAGPADIVREYRELVAQ